MPLTIHNVYFKNQKEAKEYVNQILEKWKGKYILNEDLIFTKHLISRHPCFQELVKKKVDGVLVKRNKYQDLNFWLIYKDKTMTNLSHNKCITARDKTYNTKLALAMRTAIKDQIDEFRDSNFEGILECPLCLSVTREVHVDHMNPKFRHLKEMFLDGWQGSKPVTFEKHENLYCEIFTKDDSVFKREWEKFHKENAQLRIICPQCNLEER